MRRALARAVRAAFPLARGRRVHDADLHLTLHFLGEVDPGHRSRLETAVAGALRRQPAPRIDLEIERAGAFRGARVAWLGPRQAPPALVALHAALGEALSAADFDVEPRPLRAHVTSLRQVQHVSQGAAFAPVRWTAKSIALVESRPDRIPVYRVLRRFRLGGRRAPVESGAVKSGARHGARASFQPAGLTGRDAGPLPATRQQPSTGDPK